MFNIEIPGDSEMQTVLSLRGFAQAGKRLRGLRVSRPEHRQIGKVRCCGKAVILTDKAPAPLGAYSQAVKANKFLFVGGQLGIAPGGIKFVDDGPAGQAEQAMKNLGAILEAGGSSFEKVVKTTILLANIEDFKEVNAVYAKYFPEDPPARATYAAKGLPLNALVEIEAVATTD